MAGQLRFDGRVAIVTGAGGGLGRAHAMLLASRGARVVVNDLGGDVHGDGSDVRTADAVVAEIEAAGGEAIADYNSVTEGEKIIQTALDAWGKIDILINNAGILRDKSFAKMRDSEWEAVQAVHLYGAYKVTHAAWTHMRENKFGRIVMTSSASGLYGNFGQANYSAAKLGLIGLTNTLVQEGHKYNVLTNAIAPVAGTRMTAGLLPDEVLAAIRPELVSPLVAYLCHEETFENGGVFELGGGWVTRLRWQRTRGVSFPLDNPFTIEDVAAKWNKINDFTDAENPTSVQDAFAPIIANLRTAATKFPQPTGKIDPDRVLGHEFEPTEHTYTERDVSLYALGVGAATNPLDPHELKFVYELNPGGFYTLPTYGVVVPAGIMLDVVNIPGLEFNPMMLVHGEQYTEIKKPLPTSGTLFSRGRVANVYDKRVGALIEIEVTTTDDSGDEVAFNRYSVFIRGLGNFGGERGPSGKKHKPPTREPDATHQQATTENQALLYRLSGDPNPLHADPKMAAEGGFDRPILHGLCTFGFAGRAVLKHFANNDPARFKSIEARFSEVVFPGETIITEMWRDGDFPAEEGERIVLRCKLAEREGFVLTNAAVVLHPA